MLRLDRLDLFVVASQASWYGPSETVSLDADAAGGYVLTGACAAPGRRAHRRAAHGG